jgi:uncharacterized membrane protein YukC
MQSGAKHFKKNYLYDQDFSKHLQLKICTVFIMVLTIIGSVFEIFLGMAIIGFVVLLLTVILAIIWFVYLKFFVHKSNLY